MKTREPIFEKSRTIEDIEHMRLMALLNELVRDRGPRKAAETLGVDHRTLTSSLNRGTLSRRMRVALEKALLEGAGSPAAEQRKRNDRLLRRVDEWVGRVEELEKSMSKGLAAVQGDVKAVRDEVAQVVRRLAKLETGEAGDGSGDAQDAGRGNTAPRRRARTRREFPDLVTLDPADDDEEIFGVAWPLIIEWRELKATHPNGGRGIEWLRVEERLLDLELTLLETHGMTLPPETYPLRGFERGGQINWRRTALSDTRRELRKHELLWTVVRVCTFGRWRK